MALIACTECRAEISDKAAACPSCGAKIKRFKWWLWLPLAAVLAFFALGASVPQYESDARAARNICEQSFARGAVSSLSECNRLYDDMIVKGKKP
ncbi:zinc-ribbon domain-containing protein [Variovorax boronicumulans]|uniref:zinc-ribbon domain-containing protein n=1 Tax=Variovorax boronicumulans TaxID=436515 RepID=UPI001C55D8D9